MATDEEMMSILEVRYRLEYDFVKLANPDRFPVAELHKMYFRHYMLGRVLEDYPNFSQEQRVKLQRRYEITTNQIAIAEDWFKQREHRTVWEQGVSAVKAIWDLFQLERQ